MQLSLDFDVYGVLERGGITPGNSYSITKIMNVLENQFG